MPSWHTMIRIPSILRTNRRSASATVNHNLNILRSLVDTISSQDEQKLMNEFTTCWAEFSKLDQVILGLAIENTNLKAATLSREKGAETIRIFEQALEHLVQVSASTQNESRIAEPVSRALIAGLKMYNLHSAHIAEPLMRKWTRSRHR